MKISILSLRKFSRASSHNNSTKNHHQHHTHQHQQQPHLHNHSNNNDVDMPEVNSSTAHHTIKQESNHDHAYDSDEREHEGDPAVDLSTQN